MNTNKDDQREKGTPTSTDPAALGRVATEIVDAYGAAATERDRIEAEHPRIRLIVALVGLTIVFVLGVLPLELSQAQGVVAGGAGVVAFGALGFWFYRSTFTLQAEIAQHLARGRELGWTIKLNRIQAQAMAARYRGDKEKLGQLIIDFPKHRASRWRRIVWAFPAAAPILIGAAFLAFWTFALLLLWSLSPDGAFTGLGDKAALGDFVYLAVNIAVVNSPTEPAAVSRVARMALTIEVLSGATLLAAYASSLLRFRRQHMGPAEAQPSPGAVSE